MDLLVGEWININIYIFIVQRKIFDISPSLQKPFPGSSWVTVMFWTVSVFTDQYPLICTYNAGLHSQEAFSL